MSATDHAGADVEVLLAELACRRLQETYCYAEVLRDVDLLVSVFTADARYGSVVGALAIREFASTMLSSMSAAHMRVMVTSSHIVVDGNNATGIFHTTALFHSVTHCEERLVLLDAGYRDDFIRMEDGWRITWMRGIEHSRVVHDVYFGGLVQPLSLQQLRLEAY